MVGIVLITHEGVAEAYLNATSRATKCDISRVVAISIKQNEDKSLAKERAMAATEAIYNSDGILIITDQKGSSPSNIGVEISKEIENIAVVSGLNMAMLIRVLDRRERNNSIKLKELAKAAEEAGKNSIEIIAKSYNDDDSDNDTKNNKKKGNNTVVKKELTIQNERGLHASAAAKLVHLANKFDSDMLIIKDGRRIDAKSILGVLTFAAAKGEKLLIEAKGYDAQQAIDAIEELFNNKFGEPK